MTLRSLIVAVLVVSFSAHAVDCPAPPDAAVGSLARQSADARLQFMAKRFQEESDAAKRWTAVWGGRYAALTLVQLALLGVVPREAQPDWYWGALSSAVGVAFSVLGPLEVMDAGPVFAKRAAAATGEGSDEQKTCELLVEGERMLREGADAQNFSRAWFIHVGNVLFNVGIGLVLGLGYGRWTSAAINALSGAAIGELTIFTSPNQLISGWDEYRSGPKAKSPVTIHVVPTAGPGLGLVINF